jgi:hypothetical protein
MTFIRGRLWLLDEWLKTHGARYGIGSMDVLRRQCRGDVDARTGHKAHLPDGWHAFMAKRRWFLHRGRVKT